MGFIECPEREPWVGAAIPFLWSPYAFPCTTKTLHRSGRLNRLAERLSFFCESCPAVKEAQTFLAFHALSASWGLCRAKLILTDARRRRPTN